MAKAGKFVGGFLVGGLTGAGAALLLAPYRGEELKNRIEAWANQLMEEGREAALARQAELEAELEAFKKGQPVENKPIETTV